MIGENPNQNLFEEVRAIYEAALASVSPARLIGSSVSLEGDLLKVQNETFDLYAYKRIFLIAFGKAAAGMAETLAAILGVRLTEGIVVVPRTEAAGPGGTAATPGWWAAGTSDGAGEPGVVGGRNPRLDYFEAGHPLPDEVSVAAARRTLALAERAQEDDLVFVCISGGGSALLCLPGGGITLDEKKRVTHELLKAGADIRELNAVRKHLSGIKGGGLTKALFPAASLNLVISDVIGDDMEIIASGPTHWDSSTFADAKNVLEKYGVWISSPPSVLDHIERGVRGETEETLKKDDPLFSETRDFILGNNMTGLRGARREAERRGYETYILSASDEGEARHAARDHVAFISTLACSLSGAPKPTCLLAGGELTVTVTGGGRGGRNMEYVLASLVEIRKSGVEEAFCGTCHDPGSTVESGEERAIDPFADAKPPLSGRGQEARLRVNPEQAPAFMPGTRGVDWIILSLGTDGIDGPTDAAGAWIDPATFGRVHDLGLAAETALDDNDSYGFFKKTGNLIVTGPTGTNVMDIRISLVLPRRSG